MILYTINDREVQMNILKLCLLLRLSPKFSDPALTIEFQALDMNLLAKVRLFCA